MMHTVDLVPPERIHQQSRLRNLLHAMQSSSGAATYSNAGGGGNANPT